MWWLLFALEWNYVLWTLSKCRWIYKRLFEKYDTRLNWPQICLNEKKCWAELQTILCFVSCVSSLLKAANCAPFLKVFKARLEQPSLVEGIRWSWRSLPNYSMIPRSLGCKACTQTPSLLRKEFWFITKNVWRNFSCPLYPTGQINSKFWVLHIWKCIILSDPKENIFLEDVCLKQATKK